jgi:hypothetical protein
MITMSDAVRTRARELLAKLNRLNTELEKLGAVQDRDEAARDEAWGGMNYRERYFGGKFGGDTAKVRTYRDLQAAIAGRQARLDGLQTEIAGVDACLFRTVDIELARLDRDFRDLTAACWHARAADDATLHFLELVQVALAEVQNASSCNTMDAVLPGPVASMMDYSATENANRAIRAVNAYAGTFMAAVTALVESRVTPDLLEELNRLLRDLNELLRTLDFMDMFTELSIGDLFQMSELSDMEDRLSRHEGRVQQIHALVRQTLEPLIQRRWRYHTQQRNALL